MTTKLDLDAIEARCKAAMTVIADELQSLYDDTNRGWDDNVEASTNLLDADLAALVARVRELEAGLSVLLEEVEYQMKEGHFAAKLSVRERARALLAGEELCAIGRGALAGRSGPEARSWDATRHFRGDTVACPTCGARPREHCYTHDGRQTPSTHAERRRLSRAALGEAKKP